MPLIIPVSSNNSSENQGGGGGGGSSSGSGGLGPLSQIYAEYENSKKKTAEKKRSRSRSADRKGSRNGRGDGVQKKKKRSSALQDLPILHKPNVAAVDENCQKQCNKMALKKREEDAAPPCSYVDGCTNKSVKDGLCKTHWCTVNLCTRDGCIKKAWSNGLCREHKLPTSTSAHDTLLMRSTTVGTEEVKMEEASMENNPTDAREVPPAKTEVASTTVNKPHENQQKKNACGGAKKSVQRKICITEGCSNQAVVNGVCFRHGAKRKVCNADGCTNHAIRGGVCYRHGAKRKLCKVDGCTNVTQRKGLCVKHGAHEDGGQKENKGANVGRPALCVEIPPDLSKSSSESQSNASYLRSVSSSSTEMGSIDAVSSKLSARNQVPSSSDGSSPPIPSPVTKECTKTKTGRKAKSCKTEGCTNRAIQGGQCFRHGAKSHRKLCSSEGCKNYVVKGGLCIKHGARNFSKENDENEPEQETSVKLGTKEDDVENKGRKAKSCKTEGCTNRAIQGGQCFRHGAKSYRKLCSSEGCQNYVVKAGLCIKHGAREGTKKNAEEEPKHEKAVQSLKQEDDNSWSVDDVEKREQDELFKSIDRLEGNCADILLLLKNNG